MFFKTSLAVVTLLTDFLFTGWILNWAPMQVMMTEEGYYADLCTTKPISITSSTTPIQTCNEQQVGISKLWSAVLLSEFTVLPYGILLDWIGPALFSLLIFITHVASLVVTIYMSRNDPLLVITFFFMGSAAQACSLLAMRTVYIFNTLRARKRWIVACCTIFDSSAICTMILYNIWDVNLISLENIFWILAIPGGILYGAQFCFWLGFNKVTSTRGDQVVMAEEVPLLDKSLIKGVGEGEKNQGQTVLDVFAGYKFYFFILLCAVNIYRIRYFLGVAYYTLVYLHDSGIYLQLLGYCFVLSVVFAPLVDAIISKLEGRFLPLHIVNISVTAYFITWMIPNLPIQVVTFVLFILARLFTFSVLTDYCSLEFTEERFGLVLGAGFLSASIPGAFTFKVVRIALTKYNENFWVFHLICMGVSIPVAMIIYVVQRNSEYEAQNIEDLSSKRTDVIESASLTPM